MDVARFRRRPQPADDEVTTAARYQPGGPLDDLRSVAGMAFAGDVAECALPRGTVLVAAWDDFTDDEYVTRFVVVEAGNWLAYSSGGAMLYGTDSADLERFYEPLPQAG